jgi:uncharacterized protein YjbI with pentapeptide repeats
MANQQHLNILRQGTETWNRWREENPQIKPDLRRIVLSGTDLSGANLSRATLTGVNLDAADLDGAITDETLF